MLCTITYFVSKSFIEPSINDLFIRLTLNDNPSDEIVNIAIDEKSISKVGRWAWNRNLYGEMFEYLESSGAKAIAFDSVITTTGNEKTDKIFFKQLKSLDKVILGMFFCNKLQNSSKDIEKFSIKIDGKNEFKIPPYKYYANILPEIVQNAPALGSVLSPPDNDGVIRKLSPVFLYRNKFYPSLALKAAMEANQDYDLKFSNHSIIFNTSEIPLDSEGQAYIRWFKPKTKNGYITHTTYSASDVLESYQQQKNNQTPKITKEHFKNKIVVIGTNAYALNDIKKTPIGIDYPGIEIQATFIDNIMHGNFMLKVNPYLNFVILIILTGLSIVAARKLQIVYSLLTLISLILVWFYTSLKIYSDGFIIDVITPVIFMLLAYSLTFVYKYFLEGRSKHNLQNVMSKYISKQVMKNVMESEQAELGGKRAYVSVLFADIRQFTSIAEVYTPEEVSVLLNEYFSVIAPIIDKYNGTLNKFMGDAVMAIFGEPIHDENHPKNAVLCASEILHEVKKLNYKWKIANRPEIKIGIAINTGSVFIGNIGSNDRLEFTIIGDTVNIASRIESLNRIYNTSFLISSSTYEKVKDIVSTIKIRDVSIKGRASSVTIHEVIKIKDEHSEK